MQGPLTAAPNSFDGHYYTEVVTQTGRRGWFDSDRHLNDQGAPTAPLMQVRWPLPQTCHLEDNDC